MSTYRRTRARSRSRSRSRRGGGLHPILIAAIAAVAIIAVLFVGKLAVNKVIELKKASEIKETLTTAETALEEGDVNGLLDVIDPDIAGPIKTITSFGITDSSEIFNQLVGELNGSGELAGALENAKDNLNLEMEEYEIEGDYAAVKVKASYTASESNTYEQELILTMQKIDDQWYIMGVQGADA